MPQHKVAASIEETASLKDLVKDDTVLQDGPGIIDAALAGDTEVVVGSFEGEFKEFQISHDDGVLKGAVTGAKLAKALLTHL